jgi:hypothetical protein
MWTRFIWLRIRSGDRFLWTWEWNFGFRKTREISWPAYLQSVSQGFFPCGFNYLLWVLTELMSMLCVIKVVSYNRPSDLLKNRNTSASEFKIIRCRECRWWIKSSNVFYSTGLKIGLPWDGSNCSATQEIPSILCNTKVCYSVHKSPPLPSVMN